MRGWRTTEATASVAWCSGLLFWCLGRLYCSGAWGGRAVNWCSLPVQSIGAAYHCRLPVPAPGGGVHPGVGGSGVCILGGEGHARRRVMHLGNRRVNLVRVRSPPLPPLRQWKYPLQPPTPPSPEPSTQHHPTAQNASRQHTTLPNHQRSTIKPLKTPRPTNKSRSVRPSTPIHARDALRLRHQPSTLNPQP